MTTNKAAMHEPAPVNETGKEIDPVIKHVLAAVPEYKHQLRKDLTDRANVGLLKYGVPLHLHNGRNAAMDAYQEALDLLMYLGQRELEAGREIDMDDYPFSAVITILEELQEDAHR